MVDTGRVWRAQVVGKRSAVMIYGCKGGAGNTPVATAPGPVLGDPVPVLGDPVPAPAGLPFPLAFPVAGALSLAPVHRFTHGKVGVSSVHVSMVHL